MKTDTPRAGFAGLGAMGAPMARNLAKAGLLAAVYNRTAAKGDRAPANHAASTSGRDEERSTSSAPFTKNATAPSTHVAIPSATLSNAQPLAPPITS